MKVDVYTIAHEVKNPLCVVKGYLEMMNEENFERYRKIINDELNNSINILDNYLEYKKMNINKEIMDINILFLEIKEKYQEYLSNKNIHLHVSLNEDEIYLLGDYNKLKEVISNIIKNSIESQSKNIYLNYQLEKEKIKLIIENDGFKINENDIKKIGHNYTNKIIGHGIGTTINEKIIELHGGNIEYMNTITGVKTIITLFL